MFLLKNVFDLNDILNIEYNYFFFTTVQTSNSEIKARARHSKANDLSEISRIILSVMVIIVNRVYERRRRFCQSIHRDYIATPAAAAAVFQTFRPRGVPERHF